MSERFRVQVVFMLVGDEDVIDVLGNGLQSDPCLRQNVGVEPGAEVGAFGQPGVGQDFATGYLNESTGLAEISNPHGASSDLGMVRALRQFATVHGQKLMVRPCSSALFDQNPVD